MKKTIGVFGLFLLLLAFSVSAHTLDGVVTDANSGLTVSGVTVKVSYDGTTVYDTTDFTGSYSVDLGNLTIVDHASIFIQKSTKWSQASFLLDMQAQGTTFDLELLSHPQCSDLVDNDRDGRIDMDDRQCTDSNDDTEASVYNTGNGRYAVGVGMGIITETENFEPRIWLHTDGCTVLHNKADGGKELVERVANYAFEGEQIHCEVLVMDKNGIEKIRDVYAGLSPRGQQALDFDIEANCNSNGRAEPEDYNARIQEELLTEFKSSTMRAYSCVFTVETANSMYGEYFLSFVVEDLDGEFGSIDENQYWFFNPMVGITIYGDINFGVVRPGTMSYSDTLVIENTADPGSGVLLDMSISGSDFYDPDSSGAKCPVSNVLNLGNFAYYASNGAYRTKEGVSGRSAGEGYFNIPYEVSDPDARAAIIEDSSTISLGGVIFPAGNMLTPGADIALTFRLALPEPCNGDFSDGSIYFWGEAI